MLSFVSVTVYYLLHSGLVFCGILLLEATMLDSFFRFFLACVSCACALLPKLHALGPNLVLCFYFHFLCLVQLIIQLCIIQFRITFPCNSCWLLQYWFSFHFRFLSVRNCFKIIYSGLKQSQDHRDVIVGRKHLFLSSIMVLGWIVSVVL